jgi:hypothetical protein
MNGLLETRPPITDPDTEPEEIDTTEAPVVEEETLDELKRRCRDLLAKRCPDACAPGHWLG